MTLFIELNHCKLVLTNEESNHSERRSIFSGTPERCEGKGGRFS
jgi:hypothetical protein